MLPGPLTPLELFRRVPCSCVALPGAWETVEGGARFCEPWALDRLL
jgi:hypothetical protein